MHNCAQKCVYEQACHILFNLGVLFVCNVCEVKFCLDVLLLICSSFRFIQPCLHTLYLHSRNCVRIVLLKLAHAR
jgi:hypothetical protein